MNIREHTTKDVHTKIPYTYWHIASSSGLSWRDVLIAGINVLCGVANRKDNILESIKQKKNEISVLKQRLDYIIKNEQKKKEEDEKKVVMRF